MVPKFARSVQRGPRTSRVYKSKGGFSFLLDSRDPLSLIPTEEIIKREGKRRRMERNCHIRVRSTKITYQLRDNFEAV
uniref:Uncharacterized protein n=1 Tax=Arundo donax TaxID=35708 RepID=A0A0A8YS84_ARUDO